MEDQIIVGIDLGGRQIKGVALSPVDGTCLMRQTALTRDGQHEKGVPAFLVEARKLVDGLQDALGKSACCVGVSAPGLARADGSAIAFMPQRLFGLEGLDWAEGLGRTERVPVLNDAHSALIGEIAQGAAKGLDHVVMLTLGTGVGGAIMSGGRLLKGRYGRAGHLGHMTVDFDGPPDICNTPGSLEDAIGDATVAARSKGRFTTTQALIEACRARDAEACEVWHRSLRALAAGIVSITNAVDPEVVVIGGGITAAGDLLFDSLKVYIFEREWRPAAAHIELRPASLGTWAGAIGAGYYAWQGNGYA